MRGLLATYHKKQGWQPDPTRTIFYYDFEDSNNRLKDSSGNNNNLTDGPNITYTTVGTETVAETTSTRGGFNFPSSYCYSIGYGDYTVSFWMYFINSGSGKYPLIFGTAYTSNSGAIELFFDPSGVNGKGNCMVYNSVGSQVYGGTISASGLYNGWHHIVVTRHNYMTYCYIDTTLDTSFNDPYQFASSGTGCFLSRVPAGAPQYFNAGAKGDKLIFENIWWSVDDVINYYNQTKSLYGIS